VLGGASIAWAVLDSVLWALLALAAMLLGFAVLQELYRRVQLATILRDLWRSVGRALQRTGRIVAYLLPLAVVFLFLSIFSSELWKAVSTVNTCQFWAVVVWVLLLGGIVAAFRGSILLKSQPGPDSTAAELANSTIESGLLDGVRDAASAQVHVANEMNWHHSTRSFERAVELAECRRRWRILTRLVTTSIVLGVAALGYLVVLLGLLFNTDFIREMNGLGVEQLPAMGGRLRLAVFLADFVIAYFLTLVVTDDSVRNEVLHDLSTEFDGWVGMLLVYDAFLTPQYQLLQPPVRAYDVGLGLLEIVVPAGSDEAEVKQTCERARQRWLQDLSATIVTAYELIAAASYDWDCGGVAWQSARYFDNDGETRTAFGPLHEASDSLRYQHDLASQCLVPRRPPDRWFGPTGHDQDTALAIWEMDNWRRLHHPYAHSCEGNLRLYLRMKAPFEERAQRVEWLGSVLRQVKTTLQPRISLVSICMYEPSPNRVAWRLVWSRISRRQLLIKDGRLDQVLNIS
jgi:hypothetical protein